MPLFDDQEKETAEMELTELQSMIGKMKENITLSSIATMLEGFTQAVNKLEELQANTSVNETVEKGFSQLIDQLKEIQDKINFSEIAKLVIELSVQNRKVMDVFYKILDVLTKKGEPKDVNKDLVILVVKMMDRQQEILSQLAEPRSIEINQLPAPERKKLTIQSTFTKNKDNTITITSKEL